MLEKNWLGSKTDGGFYKRIKDDKGKSTILSLDLKTLEYSPLKKYLDSLLGGGQKSPSI